MGVFLLLGGLALLGAGLMGRRTRTRTTGAGAGTGTPTLCDTSAATAATFPERARLLAWTDCPTRTAVQVAELERHLNAASRTDEARRVRARWNARRTVEDEPATGAINDPTDAAHAHAATTSQTAPADVPASPVSEGGPTHALDSGATYHGGGEGTGTPAYTMEAGPVTVVRPGSRSAARALVGETIRALNRRTNYRSVLRRFQTAAGVTSDGIYGGRTENALRHFGGDPPAAFRPPLASSPDAAYTPPTAE